MKRRFNLFLIIILSSLFFYSCSRDTASPEIDVVLEILNEVNTDTLQSNISKLSGLEPVVIDGVQTHILSRHSYHKDNDIAADYLEKKLTQFGYTVTNDQFNSAGRNIIAELKGIEFPDQYYIICAHYDSMPLKGNAPGADDNGSGTVAVLEAARLLKDKEPQYSIIFALWDEEEQGLFGSKHYAANAASENKNILGVINLDMIGFDSDNNNAFTFVTWSEDEVPKMVDEGLSIISDYNLNLTHNFLYGRTYSDHASFWQHNYPAILIIEDYQDFNSYYHTDQDISENINYVYLTKTTKLAIGILSKLALGL